MELKDRTVVVTGGAGGMGLALLERLTAMGARPVAWDIAPGAEIHCDVTDAASVDAAIKQTIAIAGVPTAMAATAGVGHHATLDDLTEAEWDRVMSINLKGPWLSMRAVAKAMQDAGEGGAIVAVTSVSAQMADRAMGAYCASKAGLEMLVKVAAHEWAERGIRVNAVGPGVTATPMLGRAPETGMTDEVVQRTPLGRLGQAGDIADAILALLQLDWVTGQIVMADGGLSLYSPIDMVGAAERKAAREAAGSA
ncbi:MAG: dehydrogenase, short-chain alcohol dehydrogenase like protein [Actinomycetia bacterium]|nr:dehydrogenase, short-chain alcohol dehydrogenase like protein [Actinomycetes bacterium]